MIRRWTSGMRSALGLALVGAMSACATSTPLPTVVAPEAVIEARLYDLGGNLGSDSSNSDVLAAGFGGDARARRTATSSRTKPPLCRRTRCARMLASRRGKSTPRAPENRAWIRKTYGISELRYDPV